MYIQTLHIHTQWLVASTWLGDYQVTKKDHLTCGAITNGIIAVYVITTTPYGPHLVGAQLCR